MDLTPQLLRDAEFTEQRKGYDRAEVKSFLGRLADAVSRLQDDLTVALDRANRAERRLLDTPVESDELQRTLVLAQRTVDAALEEGRQQAAQLVADAEARAAAVQAEADERAGATTRAADERAATVVAEAEGRVASEIVPLLDQREALQRDVDALRTWATQVRERMADELRQQLAWLDDPAVASPPAPELVDIVVPDRSSAADPAEGGHRTEAMPALPDGGEETGPDGPEAADRERDDGPAGEDGAGEARSEPTAVIDLRPAGGAGADDGPLARAAAEDPFLAELRRAVTDDEPLGPRDQAEEPGGGDAGGGEDLLGASSVFRRRKRT